MKSNKLLPCPFCGYEAFDSCFPTDYPTEHCRAYVRCKSCGVEIHRDGNVKNAKELVKECIRAWNTRKPMGQIVEQLEEKSNDIPIQYENNYEQGYANGIDYAIEIVRKGGVDNAVD